MTSVSQLSCGSMYTLYSDLHQIRRPVPPGYDDTARWILETSDWTGYSYDVSDEDEQALANQQIPPSAIIHPPIAQLPPKDYCVMNYSQESIPPPEVAPPLGDDSTDSANLMLVLQTLFGTSNHSASLDTNEADNTLYVPPSSAPSTPENPFSGADRFEYMYHSPELSSQASAMSDADSCTSTPSLSFSSSSDSGNDFEFDSDGDPMYSNVDSDAPGVPPPFMPTPEMDLHQLPFLPYMQPPMITTFHPIGKKDDNGASYAHFMLAPQQNRATSPNLPLKTPSPKSRGAKRATPYTKVHKGRKAVNDERAKVRPAPAVNRGPMACPTCDYVQTPGSGDARSFRRHLETHKSNKKVEWWCNGVMRPDGTRRGGCGKLFSRKDALQRHCNNSDCMSDYEPTVVMKESQPVMV